MSRKILDSPLKWNWTVPECESDRADRLIFQALQNKWGDWSEEMQTQLSRNQIKSHFEKKLVSCNGEVIKASRIIRAGETLQLILDCPPPTQIEAQSLPLEILFQDEHIAVVNKPGGIITHPTPDTSEPTLVHALLHHLDRLCPIGGPERPGIVHRLDRHTSGAMVVAKSDAAYHRLIEIFSKHHIDRRYSAYVYGSPELQTRIKIEAPIGRHPQDRKKMAVVEKGGKRAISRVTQKAAFSDRPHHCFGALLEVQLETGRTHQVRVHLAEYGHSLLGDPTYGCPRPNQPKWKALPIQIQEAVRKLPGQALHAFRLGFDHPITGETLQFEASLPDHLRRLDRLLRNYEQ